MDTDALLEQAILHREQVVAVYAGEERVFCPHALGTKGQRRHVLAYQFAGGSRSGLPPGGDWRCFAVDDLEAEVARLKAQGVQLRNEVMEFHDRRLVFLSGPEGVTVELAEWDQAHR